KSGSEWYGDLFDLLTTRNYNLSFSNISSSPVHVTVNLVAKHTSPSSFNVTESNSGAAVVVPINAISAGSTGKFASETRDTLTFVPTSNNVSLSVTYNKPSASANGWLNNITVNARRQLIYSGVSLGFRDLQSIGAGNIASYQIQNGNQISEIWEVTVPSEANSIAFDLAGGVASFTKNSDSLREFIAFSGSSFSNPKFFGKIQN